MFSPVVLPELVLSAALRIPLYLSPSLFRILPPANSIPFLLCIDCGMMAIQGSAIDWVSDHRYHHLHTETPLDPHSSYEGFYWSHIGWMLDSEPYKKRCGDQSNVADLQQQAWYRHSHNQYAMHLLAHFFLIFSLGGVAGICWRAFFLALLYQ